MKSIPLGRSGRSALVDDADYDRLTSIGNWTIQPGGHTFYATHQVRDADGTPAETLVMHQVVSGHGFVDHINGNGLDNRRSNLRAANHSTNGANRRVGVNSTTGFKGVYRHTNRWQACIRANGVKHYLGSFASPEAAAQAYDTAARDLFGEYARLNLPT